MRIAILLFPTLVPLTSATAIAQQVGPVVAQPKPQECEDGAADPDEIVVCGEPYDVEGRYRIPPEFRDQPSKEDRHAAWGVRVRDENEIARFSDQTIGPFGYLQRSRQLYCEWLVAGQERQGRQADCTRKPRPDEATDWQRR